MTTIAYKDGVIAYDSRMTAYSIVVDDDYRKLFQRNDTSLFYCGDVGDIDDYLKFYFDNEIPKRLLDCESLVYEKDKLYCSDVVSEGDTFRIRKMPLRKDGFYAIGSGTRFALAFMDVGMDAYDSVIATAKRDVWTGGTIRTYQL